MNSTITTLSGMISAGTAETMLAELARAVSRVAERHQYHGALIDIELDLWQAQKDRHKQAVTDRPESTAPAEPRR